MLLLRRTGRPGLTARRRRLHRRGLADDLEDWHAAYRKYHTDGILPCPTNLYTDPREFLTGLRGTYGVPSILKPDRLTLDE